MNIASQYLTDSCDIYSYGTGLKGNIEVTKELSHEDVGCYAEKISNIKMAMALGIQLVETFKIIIPFTYNGESVTVGEHYKITLTKNGITHKLRVENCTKCKSHWLVEAIEDNV